MGAEWNRLSMLLDTFLIILEEIGLSEEICPVQSV